MTPLDTPLRPGDLVRTASTVRPERFAEREGLVIAVNDQDDEVGVRLGSPATHSAAVWFRPSELHKLGHTATRAALGARVPPRRAEGAPKGP